MRWEIGWYFLLRVQSCAFETPRGGLQNDMCEVRLTMEYERGIEVKCKRKEMSTGVV
jgi:hypothetical protein